MQKKKRKGSGSGRRLGGILSFFVQAFWKRINAFNLNHSNKAREERALAAEKRMKALQCLSRLPYCNSVVEF